MKRPLLILIGMLQELSPVLFGVTAFVTVIYLMFTLMVGWSNSGQMSYDCGKADKTYYVNPWSFGMSGECKDNQFKSQPNKEKQV